MGLFNNVFVGGNDLKALGETDCGVDRYALLVPTGARIACRQITIPVQLR
jgi:hypothetical protein